MRSLSGVSDMNGTMQEDGRRPGEVEIKGVAKRYEGESSTAVAVEDCSFVVERGKFTVIVGPSGCGKTTLINLIAGYEPATAGEVRLDGRLVTGPGPDRLVVFQETALFPWMTTIDNVIYGPKVQRRLSRHEITAKAEQLLDTVGLTDFRDKFPAQLSGGMQRRAELARALINEPAVLLMDEPFRGLDAMTRELMQEYLLALFEGSNRTILFVTSEIDEAILFADNLIVLSRSPGKVRAQIPVDLGRPRTLDLLTKRRYAELKHEALGILYEEAVGAFASGVRSASDIVEAYQKRGTG